LKAVDVRDKLFGLLGLDEANGLGADYSLSTKDVYVNFGLWCLRSMPELKSLSHAGGLDGVERHLPSWIPCPYDSPPYSLYLHFHASGEKTCDIAVEQREDTRSLTNDDGLCLKGNLVDSLRDATWPLTNGADLEGVLLEAANILGPAGIPSADETYRKFCGAMTFELDLESKRLAPEELGPFNDCFRTITRLYRENEKDWPVNGSLRVLRRLFGTWSYKRRFCVTSNDRLAWIPMGSEDGDEIYIIRGARVPFVLRPQGNGQFVLIGECYIQGLMDGEALSLLGFARKDICLV
jgi:hypothetical protein